MTKTDKRLTALVRATEKYRAAKKESDRLRAAQRDAILKAIQAGVSQRQAAMASGLERATINRWAQTARNQGMEGV